MGESRRGLRPRNPIFKKQQSANPYSTLNQARVTWDPQHKPKGLLGVHLNIRSILPKCDQVKKKKILIYKIFHGKAPPPLGKKQNKKQKNSTDQQQLKSVKSSQATLSVCASHTWISIPNTIRELPSSAPFTNHPKAVVVGRATLLPQQ